ncbi:dienelactone hydrolase [Xylaria cf. heliscus]|nr:dienelactone hydrolase [Xylaria cf. heliscus]
MPFSSCCIKTFTWGGTPSGTETKLSNNDCYVTGDNKDRAILLVHDLFGWKYPNIRLLADHFAREVHATVYVPDFFGGWVVDWKAVEDDRWSEIDLDGVVKNQSREIRGPEIAACARAIKADLGFKRLGAVGYCYGGWAVCHIASKAQETPLVDAISIGHPSWLIKEDIDNISVPFQVLAPEHDPSYTPELKSYTFQKALTLKMPFDYLHFPGIVHGALVRGDERHEGEREAMERAKNAVVTWFTQFLH